MQKWKVGDRAVFHAEPCTIIEVEKNGEVTIQRDRWGFAQCLPVEQQAKLRREV